MSGSLPCQGFATWWEHEVFPDCCGRLTTWPCWSKLDLSHLGGWGIRIRWNHLGNWHVGKWKIKKVWSWSTQTLSGFPTKGLIKFDWKFPTFHNDNYYLILLIRLEERFLTLKLTDERFPVFSVASWTFWTDNYSSIKRLYNSTNKTKSFLDFELTTSYQ